MENQEELPDNNKSIILSKIPLEELLTILEGVYENGANYVDFEIRPEEGEEQTVITIMVKSEYMATPEELEEEQRLLEDEEEEEEDEDDIMDKIRREQKTLDNDIISDEDINGLI